MAANRKYMVIRTRDFRELLTQEEQQVMSNLLEKLNKLRREKNPNKSTPLYFTINMEDKYAVPAVEAYVEAIDQDEANNHNQGVKDAREVAVQARHHAILQYEGSKLPT